MLFRSANGTLLSRDFLTLVRKSVKVGTVVDYDFLVRDPTTSVWTSDDIIGVRWDSVIAAERLTDIGNVYDADFQW